METATNSGTIADPDQVQAAGSDSIRNITMVTYILYAAGIFTGGVASIIGIIIAHLKRGDAAGTIYESHLTWLIRTFWIGFALSLVGLITVFIGIGTLVLVASGIWVIFRIVKGFLAFNDRKPIASPSSFF